MAGIKLSSDSHRIPSHGQHYLNVYDHTLPETQTKAELRRRIVETWKNVEGDVLNKLVERVLTKE